MGGYTLSGIVCDTHCGECVEELGYTRAQIRVLARQQGWTCSGSGDYCPECAKERRSDAARRASATRTARNS